MPAGTPGGAGVVVLEVTAARHEAQALVDAGLGHVDVDVLEAGQHHVATGVDHERPATRSGQDVDLGPDGDDDAVGVIGERLGP